MVPVEQKIEKGRMIRARTRSPFYGMGTVGAAASSGASAGGQSGSGSSATATMSTVSSVAGAAADIAGSIVGAYYDIMGMRSDRQNIATASNIATAQFLEGNRYSQDARRMAAEEALAQNAVDSATGTALRSQEEAILRETERLRREQTLQEIEARTGGGFGRGRALPSWLWWGIGIGGVGVTFLVIWLVSRKG